MVSVANVLCPRPLDPTSTVWQLEFRPLLLAVCFSDSAWCWVVHALAQCVLCDGCCCCCSLVPHPWLVAVRCIGMRRSGSSWGLAALARLSPWLVVSLLVPSMASWPSLLHPSPLRALCPRTRCVSVCVRECECGVWRWGCVLLVASRSPVLLCLSRGLHLFISPGIHGRLPVCFLSPLAGLWHRRRLARWRGCSGPCRPLWLATGPAVGRQVLEPADVRRHDRFAAAAAVVLLEQERRLGVHHADTGLHAVCAHRQVPTGTEPATPTLCSCCVT